MNCFLAPRIIRVILIVLLKGRIMSLPRIYMKSNATDTNIFYCHCRECKLGLRTFFEHISQSKSLSSGIKILHMMDSFEKESLGCSEKQYENMMMLIMILSRKTCNKHIVSTVLYAQKWTFSS